VSFVPPLPRPACARIRSYFPDTFPVTTISLQITFSEQRSELPVNVAPIRASSNP